MARCLIGVNVSAAAKVSSFRLGIPTILSETIGETKIIDYVVGI